jgi:hypothetical protein
MIREKKPKLTFRERLARYPTYDISKGMGNEAEWRRIFAARLGMAEALKVIGERSPLEVLELDTLQSVTWIDVKAAYRRLARKFHPDVSPRTEEEFKAVQAAYEVLEDQPRFKREQQQ